MAHSPTTPAPAVLDEVLSRLGIHPGKQPIFLNFFRSDCPWCTSEIPRIAEVYGLHPQLQVAVIGIAEHESEESGRQYAESLGWKFPVIADPQGSLRAAFEIERVPSVAVIDLHGRVCRVYEGATEQLPGILDQTMFAVAHDTEPPEYSMVGNGCAP